MLQHSMVPSNVASVFIYALLFTHTYVCTGAYEPPKAAKEHETYTACRVPSQSKLIAS